MNERERGVAWDRGDEGVAIIFVMGYLAVVTLLAGTFLTALNRNVTRATAAQNHQICLNAAEGGVDHGIAMLRAGIAGEQSGTLGKSQYTVTVREAGGAYEVTSTAVLTDAAYIRARVSASVSRDSSGGVRVNRWKEVTKW